MKAKDVMTTNVFTVRPHTPVSEIAAILVAHNISTVPVVDDENRILGIVSEGDLMRRPETETEGRRSWWLRLMADEETLARHYVKSHGLDAQTVMTRDVVTVSEDAQLADIAQLLEQNRIKRVPVVRDGHIVGIVSRANIIQGLAVRRGRTDTDANVDDERIKNELLRVLENQPWASTPTINIIVNEGTVHVYGFVASDAERKALEVAAKNIAGVRSFQDHSHLKRELIGHV